MVNIKSLTNAPLKIKLAVGAAVAAMGGAIIISDLGLKMVGYLVGGTILMGINEYIITRSDRNHETLATRERRCVEEKLRDNTYTVPDLEHLSLDALRYQLTDTAGRDAPAQFVGQQLVNLHHGNIRPSALESVLESVGAKAKELNADAYQVSPYQFVHGNLLFMVNYFKRENTPPLSSS